MPQKSGLAKRRGQISAAGPIPSNAAEAFHTSRDKIFDGVEHFVTGGWHAFFSKPSGDIGR